MRLEILNPSRTLEFTSKEQAFQGNNYRGQPLHHIHMGGRSVGWGLELERETHKNEWVQNICTKYVLRPLQNRSDVYIELGYTSKPFLLLLIVDKSPIQEPQKGY